jgi:hypothetical protein
VNIGLVRQGTFIHIRVRNCSCPSGVIPYNLLNAG